MFKDFLKKAGIVFLQLAIFSGVLFYIAQKRGITNLNQVVPAVELAVSGSQDAAKLESNLPIANAPVAKNFNWLYGGVKYSLTINMDKSIYEYYSSSPKSYSYVGILSDNWQDQYYGMFLNVNKNDQTIINLADNLQELGKKHKLSDDQIVDLTMAFVQTINYDDSRAKEILSKDGSAQMQYPYETLYRQLGVCSDKSLLGYVLLKQMGYGVALFAFEQDNHMALGIECPKEYSTYGDGYCYSETTSIGNKIGIVPSFDAFANKTLDPQLKTLDPNQIQASNIGELGQVSMYNKISGKMYNGIVATKKIIDQIVNLRKKLTNIAIDIASQKKVISKQEDKLISMRKSLEYQGKNESNIDLYNSEVKDYNDFLSLYKKDVKKYNDSVNLYNKTVGAYNSLIRN